MILALRQVKKFLRRILARQKVVAGVALLMGVMLPDISASGAQAAIAIQNLSQPAERFIARWSVALKFQLDQISVWCWYIPSGSGCYADTLSARFGLRPSCFGLID